MKPCCPDFLAATLPGSDNEAFGRLIRQIGDNWFTGSELEPLKFCPWCGSHVPQTDPKHYLYPHVHEPRLD